MAKTSAPLPPLSPEAQEALLQLIERSTEPLLAKTLATELTTTHPVKEAQLAAVLEALVAAGRLQKYTAAKGKPRFWDRDLRTLARDAILKAVQAATSPLTAKEVSAQIAPLKITEAEATVILQSEVARQEFFEFPPSKPKGKPLYWNRDLRALEREAVTVAAQQAEHPLTAKELTGLVQSPLKLTEPRATEVLEELVAAGSLHLFPGTTAKGKPRFWSRDLSEFGRAMALRIINAKGPQTAASLKKEFKGFSDSQLRQTIDDLLSTGALAVHPPLGSVKQEVYGTRPPAPAPYFKDVGIQLGKVVALLKAARVPADDLRRVLVQLIEEAGISFGNTAAPSPQSSTEPTAIPAASVDLVALMKQIEPAADHGALIGARDLRRSAGLPKAEFDRKVLELARQGRLSLHRHDYVTSLSPTERDELVTDGDGTFYVGVALRAP